jgi:hypothetical protein
MHHICRWKVWVKIYLFSVTANLEGIGAPLSLCSSSINEFQLIGSWQDSVRQDAYSTQHGKWCLASWVSVSIPCPLPWR